MTASTRSNSISTLLFASALAAAPAACAGPAHRAEIEERISSSLESAASVEFRAEGGPLDAGAGVEGALTAGEALRLAVETSPALQAALARVRIAEAEADLAGLLPNPVLSFVFRFPESGGKVDVEAGLGADLLAILDRPRRTKVAGHRLEAECARALGAALDVVAEVREKYADAQALEALLRAHDRRLQLLDRLRDVARARLELGEAARHDVTALDAERTDLDARAAQHRRELAVARLELSRAIGEPSGDANWALDPWSPPDVVRIPEQAWIDAALDGRPEVRAIEWEIRAREEEAELAPRQALDGAAAGIEAEREDDWSVGPSFAAPIPLFDTGRARAGRARAATAEERHRLTEARRAIVEEVRVALAVLAGAQENLERVAAELIPSQRARREEIEAAYRLGQSDVTALIFADQALAAAEAQRVELARDVERARNHLERAVGGPARFRSAGAPSSPGGGS